MTTHETPAEYEASADAKQSDHESRAFERSDAAKVAAVAALAEELARDRRGPRARDHYAEGYSDGHQDGRVEAGHKIRTALADPDAALSRVRAEAWGEGYDAAYNMSHMWGHIDHWESPYPVNPYCDEVQS